MKILFATSELNPLAKVGGLADVAGSLPQALKKLKIDIRVILPRYDVIDEKKYCLKFLNETKVKFGQINELVKIYETKIPDSDVLVYLLENKRYLTGGGIYFEKSAFVEKFTEIERFLFFSQAILITLPTIGWQPNIIHCQDWHTALIPLLVKLNFGSNKIKSLFTVHNLANQGQWRAQEIFNFLGLRGDEVESFKSDSKKEKVDLNLIQQGILNANLINTVSPSYAQEILTPEFGEGLEETLGKRKNDLSGILNGIDIKIFSSENDKEIKSNYSFENLEKKQDNKKDLQQTIGLSVSDKIVFSFVGRLTNQKGSELIAQIIPEIIKDDCQFIFLGQGHDDYENELKELAKKHPQNIYTRIGFDAALAQKIYAGSDVFLMPSRFEPCGLGQMIAMRYGTVPIVRAVGGLKDSVENIKIINNKITGTGFVFEKYNAQELLVTIKKAMEIFENKEKWRQIQINAMKENFSWQASAKEYIKLYNKLV